MPVLLDHPCCTVRLDPARSILRFTRTVQPYASLDDVIELHRRIGQVFDRQGRDRHVLLVDMRAAQLNNKPEFEQAAGRARGILVRGFRRVAVLVQTAVGALQVGRHLREDNVPGEVFTDEALAIEYLGRTDLEPAPSASAGANAGDTPAPRSGISSSQDGPFGHLARMGGKR